uniref:Uncharacterized protein n=1 Tax=Anguilla anguilla TaxID=7936 RepID=A0A0E9XCY9_ANGAN
MAGVSWRFYCDG